MRYRTYGKDGPEVSVLGFGVMRLPPGPGGGWGNIDFNKSVRVMRRAMRAGVNLFDSHHLYHAGNSEKAIGQAMKGWKGQRIYIQTKTYTYDDKPLDYFKKCVEEALERTGVNRIDYLLFHSVNTERFKKGGKKFFRLTDWAMKKGYVWRRGFSSHDTPENVRKYIDTGEYSVMVLSYNWLNPTMADTIAYGAQKGMGVSIMNPVGGGSLSTDTPQVLRLIRGAKSAPEISLRYVLATPGVSVAFSGMNAVKQVDENVAVASRKIYMTPRQRQEMLERLEDIRRRGMLICTACGYCMPCPHGVDIPGNMTLLNRAKLLGLRDFAAAGFARLRNDKEGDKSALACKRCGNCLSKCPNNVPIIDRMSEAAELMGAE